MKHVTTFAVALAISLSGSPETQPALAIASGPVQPQAAAPSEPTLEVHASDAGDLELMEWAAGRYEKAGLALPSAAVYFHEDAEPCLGHDGLHTPLADGRRIDICVRGKALQTRTLLHELAHAWVGEHFAADRRDSFLELRGLDVWHDDVTAWNQRGTEHAAEIIAWGVAEETHLPGRLTNHDLDSVTEAFRFLTAENPISTTIIQDTETPDASRGLQV